MNFLELQDDLHVLIEDTRAKWMPLGNSNKAAVNHGIKSLYDRLKQNSYFKEKNKVSAMIQVVNGVADLPANFSIDYELELSPGTKHYEYRIADIEEKIYVDGVDRTYTLWYLPKIAALSADGDTVRIPEHFHDAIALFAMEKYHQAQMDWDNISRSVAYAEEKLEDLISKYY